MKMIYVSTLSTGPDRDSGWIYSFGELGWEVVSFSTIHKTAHGFVGKFQRRFNLSKANLKMQNSLIELVHKIKPRWVHFRLPIEFDRKTIENIQNLGCFVTEYFNDDPFSSKSPFGLHWKFRKALSAYDGHFVYRPLNIDKFKSYGAKYVEHCPPTYDTKRHFLETAFADETVLADVAFIGHWENDWRVKCLTSLKETGFHVILRGGGWDRAIQSGTLSSFSPVQHAFGEEYNKIYRNVIAGLCFFSKINRDAWTERALEIIAVGGVLVCERTDEAQKYFIDGKEACFFSTIEELIKIVKELKEDPSKRISIQQAGYKRLIAGNHTIKDRAIQVSKLVNSKIKE